MKKIIFVAMFAFALLFVVDVTAQTAEKSGKAIAEQIMNTRLDMLKSELNLTDAQ